MKTEILNFLLHLPDYPDQIMNTEMSFELTAGTIVVLILAIPFTLVFIFWIMGEKMGA